MRKLLVISLSLLFLLPLTLCQAGDPAKNGKDSDWPQWRGSQRNAISTETGLLKEWPKGGPKLLWDSRKVNGGKSVGIGYSSLAITQGKIFTMGDRFTELQVEYKKDDKVLKKNVRKGDGGYVFCLDAEAGKELWKTKIGPGAGDGPRSTPTVDGDRVYVLSQHGVLACLKINDGSVLWQKNLGKDFGGQAGGWQYCESPTVDGDKLVCTPGGKKAAMISLDKLTGDVYWQCEIPVNSRVGYASIVTAEVGGIKQYITLLDKNLGLVGVDAATGKFLWNYNRIANGTANIPTSLVKGEYIFASTGYDDGGSALLKLAADGQGGVKAEEQYYFNNKKLQNHHGGMVMIGDYIYGGHGHGQGYPFCLEWKTGKITWGPQKDARGGSAGVLFADGNLYFRYENNDMALIEATSKGYNLKSTFHVPIAGNGWPHPVIYHGKLFLRGDDQVLCYDIKQP
jgi:outer membrane protein assembly factor BamB